VKESSSLPEYALPTVSKGSRVRVQASQFLPTQQARKELKELRSLPFKHRFTPRAEILNTFYLACSRLSEREKLSSGEKLSCFTERVLSV